MRTFGATLAGVLAAPSETPSTPSAGNPANAVGPVRPQGRQEPRRALEISAALAAELHQFVGRRVANRDEAADIAQQTLLLACAALPTCRSENPLPWLLTIARHLIVDHYRVQLRGPSVEYSEALAETEPALQSRPDSALAAEECRERLRSLLNGINRPVRLEHQVALLLADVYGHSDKHSAAVLRMSVPCFKLLLHRARAGVRIFADENRMPVSNTRTTSQPANGDGSKKAVRANGGTPSARSMGCLGVTCRLGTPEFLALRSELLDGLKP
jgi:DNA-directed RNA polymerase specialized sigma24 family protein